METDNEFLIAVRKMDRDALARTFDLYAPPLYSYALHMCSDTLLADHIVGDVFAKLLNQLSRGSGPTTNLRSYLFEMTYHLIVDETRYAQRRAGLEAVDLLRQHESAAYVQAENRIAFGKVLTALRNNLTIEQRHVIVLRFLEGFNLRETARIIGKEVNHVKVIQNRAIGALRKALAPTYMEFLPTEMTTVVGSQLRP